MQAAIACAESLGPAEGAQLLARLQLLDTTVKAALASGSFPLALQLAEAAGAEELAAHVRLEHAAQLQAQGALAEAEQQFLLGGQPRAALRMWLGRQDWEAARRLCDEYYSPGLRSVLLAEAAAAAEAGDGLRAETLYLEAGRPDLAQQLHANDITTQATAVAHPLLRMQSAAAQLDLQTQESLLAAGSDSHRGKPGVLAAAEQAQAEGRWDEAIDAYLSVEQLPATGQEALIEVWGVAFGLAQSRRPGRLGEVAGQIGQRLCRLGQYDLAGELLLAAADIEVCPPLCPVVYYTCC